MAANVDVSDGLLDLGHMAADAIASGGTRGMMCVLLDTRDVVWSIGRRRTMARETHDTRWFQKIGVAPRAVDVVATEAGDAARIHNALHKVVALHSILVRSPVGEVSERLLAQLILFQFPEVLEIKPYVKTDRPVIILPLDRVRQRLALRVALNADVVSLHIVQACGIHNVGAGWPPDMLARRTVALFAAHVHFGGHLMWKQRYFKKIGDDFFPLPAQWDVTHKVWRVYNVKPGTDWWTKFYGTDNLERPTGPLCDGCHAVNYNIQTKTVSEWNVGCEKCHGPGGDHVKQPLPSNIWNPTRMDYVQANDTCIQCHSQGQPPTKPIQGKYYDWPVGFQVGLKLADFWTLEEHKPGETTFTHFADGSAHKNRMQGNDFVGSLMYARGVTCYSCHDVHGTENNALLRKPGNSLCLDCHGPSSPNGPHAPTIEQHTHHKAGSTGNECVGCHMPKIAQTIADVNVRSHTFKFIPPSATETLQVPNSCNSCHTDKTVQWTKDTLKTWPQFSPWRVSQ